MFNAARQRHCGTGVRRNDRCCCKLQIQHTCGVKGLNPVEPCLIICMWRFHYFSILHWGKVPEPGGVVHTPNAPFDPPTNVPFDPVGCRDCTVTIVLLTPKYRDNRHSYLAAGNLQAVMFCTIKRHHRISFTAFRHARSIAHV